MTPSKPTAPPPLPQRQWRGGASPVKQAYPVDRRRRPARRFAALTAAICAQLGRPLGDLDEVSKTRVTLASHFMLQVEALHARAASGRPVDSDELTRLSGALSRLLDDLGLSREGQEARRQQQEQAAIEERSRALGIPTFKR
jgi:hypothetical protein